MAINVAALGVDHDQLLADVCSEPQLHDDAALRLAFLGALAQLGWEKALGATGDDPMIRDARGSGACVVDRPGTPSTRPMDALTGR